MAFIEFRDAELGYGPRSVILSGVNLAIERGEFWGIVGPNGSGKTTLLRTILGLLKPVDGDVSIGGGDPVRFGYVPQRETVDTLFPITVEEIVVMGRYGHLGPVRRPGAGDFKIARQCLEHVGIADLAARSYVELSGGQKQRSLIARALASEPEVLVLDEPTNGMDLASDHGLLELVKRLHVEDRLTVILVSHQLENVANSAHKIAFVGGGKVDAGTRQEQLTAAHLSRIYDLDVGVHELDGRCVIVVRNGHP